ncbi:MAG: hypothetical protein EXQ70_06640 [Solirubrobacterales bacterium]|nr:hypothetical protein [Solirubrobacterales bacterium]
MVEVHLVAGIALLLANLVAGVWGGVAWLRRRASVRFWYALRIAQATVFIQIGLGATLLLLGHRAVDLHYLYGALPLVVSLMAETARVGAGSMEIGETDFRALPEADQRALALAIVRREMGIMAVGCLVIVGLALRAAGTSPGF